MTQITDTSLEEDVDEADASGRSRSRRAERRVGRHLETIWQREAIVREAWSDSRRSLDDYVSTVDHALRMVEIETELASAILAAEVATDDESFIAAVDRELEAWKVYVERLQARAASRYDGARSDAEELVRELRSRHVALAGSLRELRDAPPASAALERAADEVAAQLD
jgi:hypothetical protein